MVIKNARIITCNNGEIIDNGYIVINGKSITEVKSGEYTGNYTDIIDVNGSCVTPGLIDAHCHVGLFGEGLCVEGEDGNEITDPITPQLHALDAINAMDMAFSDALDYGITTVVSIPGSANAISGQACALKTHGRVVDSMVIVPQVCMKMAFGENPKKCYAARDEAPTTRMGTASIIRETLIKTQRYLQSVEKAKKENSDAPDYETKYEALIPAITGKMPVHIHAHRADDISTAIRISKEFSLDTVLIHCSEGHLIAEEVAASGYPVIIGPIISNRSKPELANISHQNYAKLVKAGAKVAVCTDAPCVPIEFLGASLAVCAKFADQSDEEILNAITSLPAKICGLDKIGYLAAGMDADILVFPKGTNPVSLLQKPSLVIVNGEVVRKN